MRVHARGHTTSRGSCGLARVAARRPGRPRPPLCRAKCGSAPWPVQAGVLVRAGALPPSILRCGPPCRCVSSRYRSRASLGVAPGRCGGSVLPLWAEAARSGVLLRAHCGRLRVWPGDIPARLASAYGCQGVHQHGRVVVPSRCWAIQPRAVASRAVGSSEPVPGARAGVCSAGCGRLRCAGSVFGGGSWARMWPSLPTAMDLQLSASALILSVGRLFPLPVPEPAVLAVMRVPRSGSAPVQCRLGSRWSGLLWLSLLPPRFVWSIGWILSWVVSSGRTLCRPRSGRGFCSPRPCAAPVPCILPSIRCRADSRWTGVSRQALAGVSLVRSPGWAPSWVDSSACTRCWRRLSC